MPYVKPVMLEQAPEAAQPLLGEIKEKFGKVLNIFGTAAHQPDVLKGMVAINDGMQQDLPAKLRELAYLKASQINQCEYCSHYHSGALKKAGGTSEQVAAIDNFADSDAYDDQEKAVLSYAEQLTKTANVDRATAEAVKGFLDDKQMVSLAAAVALANFTNRFNHGLDIDLP